MQAAGQSAVVLCLISAITCVPATAEDNAPNNWEKHISYQLVELRAELVEYFFEAHQSKLAAVAQELDEVRREQKKLQDEAGSHSEQVAQIEHQLASGDLETHMRPQIEGLRNHLIGEAFDKLRSRQAALAQHEREIIQRLEIETQRGRVLEHKARQLRAVLNQK